MQKGLSRPAKPDADAKRPVAHFTDADATAAPATDRTMSYESQDLRPLETTDSDVYEAPTLADEGQMAPAASSASAAVAKPPAPKPAEIPTRGNRFTTVQEEARRTEREQAERWSLALQFVGLGAALIALAYIGWRLTRPATADALYATITESLEENDGDPTKTEDEIAEFIERFPQDPRAAEILIHADELELRRMERSLRARTRLSGAKQMQLAERVYAEAVVLMDSDPVRASQMFEDLLALYSDAEDDDDVKQLLTLARRQLDQLREAIKTQASEQMPELAERLRAAQIAEHTNAGRAASMYRALINLYADQPWAASVVDEARGRLEALPKDAD
jgi:hypothetical protein